MTTATTDRLDRRLLALGSVVVLGTILSILDATIVNVAINTLATEFGAPIATIQWVLTAYLLGFASVIPVAGWATNRFGAKRVWIGSVSVFLAGSALAGVAWSVGSLIAFRVLQGVGAGLILPVGQAILAQAAGPQRMARVLSMIGIPLLMGSVAGPVIGGLIVTTISWRWIFLVNLPIGAVAVVFAARLLPAGEARPGARLDVRGLVLLCAGVTALTYGLSEAGVDGGFGGASTLAWLAAGAALIAGYVAHAANRKGRALIDLSLFRQRAFATSAVTNLLIAVALFGMLVLIPLYWQLIRGQDALATGLLLTPQAIGAGVAMPLAGRITDRAGAGVVVPIGLGLALAGTLAYTQVTADTSYVLLAAALFTIGLGLGASIMPSMAAAYHGMTRADVPAATSALTTVQRLGSSIGTAVLAVVLQRSIGSGAAGFGSTFWVALALIAVALVPALMLPRLRREQPAAAA
ncbi:MAG TPA: DHA2 family efflux MFS transporter permease subunit [Actinophytocola sp.]|uniref:DHA2 family efflux MFS transporter permease subunit n=1 Tax=Actinophytocola sp. TaxID=1872138 RepID=UPI002DDCDD68|nr:DHA2 family efflux MFS transporter permease subunit [Actinophytocola sp.]HEV2784094.1 DHA2 family efflux MFS transporter permease subunit [Actinophytocola sp.]